MYANNVFNLVSEFWDKEQKQFVVDLEDDIQQAAVITHNGDVVNNMLIEVLGLEKPAQQVEEPQLESASWPLFPYFFFWC